MEYEICIFLHILFVVFVWSFVIIASMKRRINDKIRNLEKKENWNRDRINSIEKALRDYRMDRK